MCKSLLECPASTEFIAAFDAEVFSDTELWKSWLAGGNRIINFDVTVKLLIDVLNSSIQNINIVKSKHTTHTCGRRKEHACKNLPHTSKTRQVKRPKWLHMQGSRFARLLPFQTSKNRTQRNRRTKRCEFHTSPILPLLKYVLRNKKLLSSNQLRLNRHSKQLVFSGCFSQQNHLGIH